MNELTPGMEAVLSAYVADFTPSEVYDDNIDVLEPTEAIINNLSGAVDLEPNTVADFLASRGFRYKVIHSDGVSGWIFRPKGK